MALASAELLTALAADAHMNRSLYCLAVHNPDTQFLFACSPYSQMLARPLVDAFVEVFVLLPRNMVNNLSMHRVGD